MAAPDPELERVVAELAAIAAGPTKAIARAMQEMAVELDRARARAAKQRAEATSPDEVLLAAIAEAYASGATMALEQVAVAIFGGMAKASVL